MSCCLPLVALAVVVAVMCVSGGTVADIAVVIETGAGTVHATVVVVVVVEVTAFASDGCIAFEKAVVVGTALRTGSESIKTQKHTQTIHNNRNVFATPSTELGFIRVY